MASATRSRTAKSNASKTKGGDDKPTYDELKALYEAAIEKLATFELTKNTDNQTLIPNRIPLNTQRPWLTDPSSTIWPIRITGEAVRMDINSSSQHYEADLLKVYVLVQDPNSFFYKDLYKARISEEEDEIRLSVPVAPDFACENPEGFLTERKKLTEEEKLAWMYKNIDSKNRREPPEFKECSEAEKKAAGRTITALNDTVKKSETKELRLFCEDGSRFHNSFAHDNMEEDELKLHWKPNDIPIKDTDGNPVDGKKCTQIWAYFYVGIEGSEKKLSGNKAPKKKKNKSYTNVF